MLFPFLASTSEKTKEKNNPVNSTCAMSTELNADSSKPTKCRYLASERFVYASMPFCEDAVGFKMTEISIHNFQLTV